jgi:hypothetical protein
MSSSVGHSTRPESDGFSSLWRFRFNSAYRICIKQTVIVTPVHRSTLTREFKSDEIRRMLPCIQVQIRTLYCRLWSKTTAKIKTHKTADNYIKVANSIWNSAIWRRLDNTKLRDHLVLKSLKPLGSVWRITTKSPLHTTARSRS